MNRSEIATIKQRRSIESVAPGSWWLGEYLTDDEHPGSTIELWAQIYMSLELTQIKTGHKLVRLIGTATDGTSVRLTQFRGFSVWHLTQAQGKRCGLAVDK